MTLRGLNHLTIPLVTAAGLQRITNDIANLLSGSLAILLGAFLLIVFR